MPSSLTVTQVTLTAAPREFQDLGLAAWLKVRLNDELELSGLTLSRTPRGETTILFPFRSDPFGDRQPCVRLLNHAVEQDLKQQILDALRAQGRLAS